MGKGGVGEIERRKATSHTREKQQGNAGGGKRGQRCGMTRPLNHGKRGLKIRSKKRGGRGGEKSRGDDMGVADDPRSRKDKMVRGP